jgi:DNA-binding SARP family transcriptional activator
MLVTLECWHDEVRVPLGGPRQRSVLAVLLLHPDQFVGTDFLTDSVWAAAPASPRSNLRTYVAGLRRCFRDAGADESVLECNAGGYRLRVCRSDVDAHVFDDLADAGYRALEGADFAGAERLFTQSLRLWRGRPLDGAAVGAPLLAQFTRLQERRLSVIEAYARAAIHNGRAESVLAELRAEVQQHPLRETLWVQLITALLNSGHRAEALRGYADVRRVLGDELGVEPGPELRDLHRRLLGTGTLVRQAPRRDHVDHAIDRDALRQLLDESAFHATRGQSPPVEFVSPSVGVWNVLEQLYAGVRHESLSFDDSSFVRDNDLPERIRVRGPECLHAALDRGVAVRQITSNGGLSADGDVGCIQRDRGGHAWSVPEIPFKMLVLDRRVAVLAANMSVLTHGALIVRDQHVVSRLVASHHALRMTAQPMSIDDAEPPSYLVPVLHQLIRGTSDYVAAAELGMSPRSYRRKVSELLTLLGIDTRFQAGAEAARRGWT